MKKVLLLLLLCVLAGGAVALYFTKNRSTGLKTQSPLTESEKDQESNFEKSDVTQENKNTSDVVSSTLPLRDMTDQIRVRSIHDGQKVSSPVVIEGEAKTDWYFEGKFVVQVRDENGKILGTNVAQAKSEETSESIPFIATIDFSFPLVSTGYIVFQKSTALGLPDKEIYLKMPVSFSDKPREQVSGGCKITGCSAHICSENDIATTCVYREEYVCYQKATCERQDDGNCGWTQTQALELCLDQFQQE